MCVHFIITIIFFFTSFKIQTETNVNKNTTVFVKILVVKIIAIVFQNYKSHVASNEIYNIIQVDLTSRTFVTSFKSLI